MVECSFHCYIGRNNNFEQYYYWRLEGYYVSDQNCSSPAILVTIGSVSARNDPPETKGIIYEVEADSVISGTWLK